MKEADSLLRLKASRLMTTCKAGLDLGMSWLNFYFEGFILAKISFFLLEDHYFLGGIAVNPDMANFFQVNDTITSQWLVKIYIAICYKSETFLKAPMAPPPSRSTENSKTINGKKNS